MQGAHGIVVLHVHVRLPRLCVDALRGGQQVQQALQQLAALVHQMARHLRLNQHMVQVVCHAPVQQIGDCGLLAVQPRGRGRRRLPLLHPHPRDKGLGLGLGSGLGLLGIGLGLGRVGGSVWVMWAVAWFTIEPHSNRKRPLWVGLGLGLRSGIGLGLGLGY